jgi:hypothetical protein
MNRRRFITQTAGTIAAGAMLPPLALAADVTAPTAAPSKADGASYAPQGKPNPVVPPGEFVFAAAHLDHSHINGQCNGLIEAGATLKWVYEPDAVKRAAFIAKYPQAKAARSLDEILADPEVRNRPG